MLNWLGGKGVAGWTAVDRGADGLVGVTVLAPGAGGKPRVVKCAAMPGGPLDAGALAGLAKKIAVPDCPWTLPLSRKEYSILMVPEPPVPPAELERSVRWAISGMIDYPADEASIAWMKIPSVDRLPNRPPDLYVLLAKSELIARHKAEFQQARIPLQAVDVRETAQRNIAALAEKPGEGVGLLTIGKQGVQFTITCNGELYLDRFVEESLFDHAQRDEAAERRAFERIALQVQRSLDFIGRTMTFIDIDRVLMAPMPGRLELDPDVISQHLSLPVEALDLASLFDFSQTPELAREENQALYFTALGAALRFMKKKA